MYTEHIHHADLFCAFTRHIIRRRWWYLGIIALLTTFFFLQMGKLRFDNSSDIWFAKEHHAIQAKKRFNDAFGNDEITYLLFTQEKTPFTPENFRLMAELADAFEENVPYLKRVTWLGNIERIVGKGENDVVIEKFFPVPPATKTEIEAKLEEALTEPHFVGDFIAADKTALSMVIEYDTYPPKDEDLTPQTTVVEAVNSVLAQPRFASLKPYITGSPHFNIDYGALVKKNMSKLFLLVVMVQMILLFFFARGGRGVMIPLGITILAVFWTMGTIGLLGITLNILSSALPAMLVCVSIGDAMHAITAFYEGMQRGFTRREALAAAFGEVGFALLLTSLTTAIGFLAYLSCDVVPYREMGIYVAIGVIYAVTLTFILTPIFYSFGKEKLPEKEQVKKSDVFSGGLKFCCNMVVTHPWAIVLFFSAVMFLTFAGYLNMKVESNTSKLIFKGEPLRDVLDLIDERMGNASTLEFLLNTKKESGINSPDFMQKLDKLMQDAEKHTFVTKATSVTIVLKQMRKALHNNDPSYYSLPESREAIAQYLSLYESSGGNTLDYQVGFLYDLARLTIKSPSLDTADARKLVEDMKRDIHEIFGDTVEVVISGDTSRYIELNDILYVGQRHSFLAALFVIAIVMMVVLRSVKLGLLSMIPNIFPVFFTMGFLGLAGYYLDIITISYAAVIIGVAVDDTIHFFTRCRQEFERLGNYQAALQATYLSVGRPLAQTTVVLVAGNAMLMFSSLLGFFKLGMLFGVAFTAALIADLLFAPALIYLLKPLGEETNTEKNEIVKKEIQYA